MTKPIELRSALFIAFLLSLIAASRLGGQVPTVPTGSITGRVTDDRGEAIAQVGVSAHRRLPDGTLDYAGSAMTNDDGIYVIERVPVGDVLVGVTTFTRGARLPSGQTVASRVISPSRGRGTIAIDQDGRTFEVITGPTWIDSGRTVPYVSTYFRGSRTVSNAQPVTVAENQRTSGIDLSLIRARTFRVSGEVVGSAGPIAGAEVRLFAEGPVFDVYNTFGPPITAMVFTDEDGRFTFLSVPDGTYQVTVAGSRNFTVRVSPEGVPYMSTSDVISNTLREGLPETTLTVQSADLTDVRLIVKPKVTVQGTVVAPRARPAMTTVRPIVQLRLGTEGIPVRVPGLMPFRIEVIPGRHQLRLMNVPGSWSVMSVMLNGRDVTGQPLDVGPDGVDGLQVMIGDPALNTGPFTVSGPPARVVVGPNGTVLPPGVGPPPGAVSRPDLMGTITGAITDAHGQPIAGLAVRLFRMFVRNGVQEPAILAGGAVTDAEGRYRIERVPPGASFIVAQHPSGSVMPGPSGTVSLPAAVDDDGVRRGYVTTFYPGTTKRSEAVAIEMRGGERAGVDFALRRLPVTNVTGNVTGDAARGFSLFVQPVDFAERVSPMTLRIIRTDASGAFTAPDLTHGRYQVTAAGITSWLRTVIDVDETLEPLRLEMKPMLTVSGRLEFGRADRTGDPASAPGGMRVQLQPVPQESGSRMPTTTVSSTGEFSFGGVPGGRYVLRVTPPAGWTQVSGVMNGQDSLQQPIELTSDVSGAWIMLATGPIK